MTTSHILLAASDSRALAFHQAFLTRLGYDVTVCIDGLDCVERLRHRQPDLLVLDLDLPWGRGEGILALMADGELTPVPVLLLAETTSLPPIAFDPRYPVRSFLPWPAPPRLLAQAIRAVFVEEAGRPSPEVDAADDWTAVPVRPQA